MKLAAILLALSLTGCAGLKVQWVASYSSADANPTIMVPTAVLPPVIAPVAAPKAP